MTSIPIMRGCNRIEVGNVRSRMGSDVHRRLTDSPPSQIQKIPYVPSELREGGASLTAEVVHEYCDSNMLEENNRMSFSSEYYCDFTVTVFH